MDAGYFVTGTDTGIGKTLVACALLHAYTRRGRRAVGMKPVAAGTSAAAGEWGNEDVAALAAAGNVAVEPAWMSPYRLALPVAPHIAARDAGVEIDFAAIETSFARLRAAADVVVVEGVGGFRVPLAARTDAADLAVRLGLPLVLVVGLRLGCLNHALLTAEAIAARGLRLAGWVANRIDPQMAKAAANVAALRERIAAPLLAEVPFAERPDAAAVAALIDVTRL